MMPAMNPTPVTRVPAVLHTSEAMASPEVRGCCGAAYAGGCMYGEAGGAACCPEYDVAGVLMPGGIGGAGGTLADGAGGAGSAGVAGVTGAAGVAGMSMPCGLAPAGIAGVVGAAGVTALDWVAAFVHALPSQ